MVVSLPVWLTTTDDGFLVGRQPEMLCFSKLGVADDADKGWGSFFLKTGFNICKIRLIPLYLPYLQLARGLEGGFYWNNKKRRLPNVIF